MFFNFYWVDYFLLICLTLIGFWYRWHSIIWYQILPPYREVIIILVNMPLILSTTGESGIFFLEFGCRISYMAHESFTFRLYTSCALVDFILNKFYYLSKKKKHFVIKINKYIGSSIEYPNVNKWRQSLGS